ncbi:MAG: PIN domain-containing protein [Deltaproteobacteria bacterium]|nr:PIN domain-containing protein [Candidatus Tharpella aukensis]
MKKSFIDSNLIIYANDCRDPEKQDKALALIKKLMISGTGVISSQVMQEYSNVALNKLDQSHEVVLRQLSLLESFEIVSISPAMVRRVIEIKVAYRISFWDASIISAAEYAACDVIYSEDLNSGQFYSGIKLQNPFIFEP